jgi:pyruvate formate lyase activating enzyme
MDESRRGFLRTVGRTAIAVGSLPVLLEHLGLGVRPALAARGFPEAKFYREAAGKNVQCLLCPLKHTLAPGQRGPCRARQNDDGILRTHAWENPAILRVDPIERLPATHFLPGSKTLTIALGGCNLACRDCPYWKQSQARPEDVKTADLPALAAVKKALGQEIKTIAFASTEPFMAYEYVSAIAKRARAKRMRVVVATAGLVREEPLLALARNVDLFTVGLRAFSETAHRKLTDRSLAPILSTITTIAKKTRARLELVSTVVPGHNDDPRMIATMCRWVRDEIGPDVPVHFRRFAPAFKMKDRDETPVESLVDARKVAIEQGLRFVYCGDVAAPGANHTRCPKCAKPVIRRMGTKVLGNDLVKGRCPHCRQALPGVWK